MLYGKLYLIYAPLSFLTFYLSTKRKNNKSWNCCSGNGNGSDGWEIRFGWPETFFSRPENPEKAVSVDLIKSNLENWRHYLIDWSTNGKTVLRHLSTGKEENLAISSSPGMTLIKTLWHRFPGIGMKSWLSNGGGATHSKPNMFLLPITSVYYTQHTILELCEDVEGTLANIRGA